VAHGRSHAVYVIDAQTMTITKKIPVGQRAWYMAFTPDESRLYVACGRSDAVSVIDVAAEKVIATVPVGKMPFAVAIPK
jgi:YVTN family beta-propeller protein